MSLSTLVRGLSIGIKAVDTVTFSVIGIVIILTGTRLYTEVRYYVQSRGSAGRFQGREPITLPYSVPYLGGFFRMTDPHAMYAYAVSKSPMQRPVKLRVGPMGIYLLFGAKNVQMIFKHSKILSKDAISQIILQANGMGKADRAVLDADTSGVGKVPLNNTPEEKRVWKKTHDLGNTHLANGHSVSILTTKFIDEFVKQLDKQPLGRPTMTLLYDFVKNVMLIGSLTSLAGPQIMKLNPDFIQTYWDHENVFLLMAIGLPRFLYWKGHLARDRMLAATTKWIKEAWMNFDEKDSDADWEENFGSSFLRGQAFALGEAGISHEGQASAMMPMIWAINSNAIPCTIWSIFEILAHPGLLIRVREEISKIAITDAAGQLTLDVPRLVTECPLLISVYLECLRIKNSVTITRQIVEDLECDGYILKKGALLMSPSYLPNRSSIWDVPGHPATSFWPERFIEMPKLAPSDPNEKSQYEIAMRPENFFPYGGGNAICTGRFFAKQEILAAVALLVLKFDIEVENWVTFDGKVSARPADFADGFAGAGIIPPDRDMRVKITRIK